MQADADGAVDLAALGTWMDTEGLGSGPIESLGLLGGGTQNLLLHLRRDGVDYVLRAGTTTAPQANRHLRREIRLVRALAATSVPHPRLIAACEDETVLGGSVFYLMEPVDGFNPALNPSPAVVADHGALRRVCLTTIDALAALANVDYDSVGLGDFGRPAGFLDRQVDRWRAQLLSYDAYDGYTSDIRASVDVLAGWLGANKPSAWEPGIMHGDFHLANVMCHPLTGEVVAIVDWEMTTIGDPLLDLGCLIAMWPHRDRPDILTPPARVYDKAVSHAELVERYGARTGRDTTAIQWYVVLACYKLAIVFEGSHARSLVGETSREVGDRLHRGALELLTRGLDMTRTPT